MALDLIFRGRGPSTPSGIHVAPSRRNLGDRRWREAEPNAVIGGVLSRASPFLPGRLGVEPAAGAPRGRAIGELVVVIQGFLGGGGHGIEGEAGVLLLLLLVLHHGGVGGGGGGWGDGIVGGGQ